MPLTRIALRKGRSQAFKQALLDQVYEAMRDSFDVPEDDRFMVLSEHDEASFAFGRRYMDIERSEDLVLIQITASEGRSTSKKQALFKAIAERLAASPGLRREDVFVNLVEVRRENWSFGNGEAQQA